MFETTSKPYKAWEEYGKMVNAADPRGLVVISAHWENEGGGSRVKGQPRNDARGGLTISLLAVNVDESNPLIYDFYGFPEHF